MASRTLTVMVLALLAAASAAGEQEDATRAARALLATRTGEDPARIAVESVQPAEWADASLGCRPATGAASHTVRGHRVLLRVGDKVHTVHVAGSDARMCTAGLQSTAEVTEGSSMKQKPQPEPEDPASRELVAKARADLQRRLSAKDEEIELIEFKAVTWPDGSLGCPRPGMVYTQVQRDGVLIRLKAQGRIFEYHGGSGRDPFLCERLPG